MPTQSHLRFTFEIIGGETRNDFEVVEFELREGLSETFHLAIELTSANHEIDFGSVLDRPGRLTLWHGDTPVRYVHGAVSSFVQRDTGFRRTRYSAIVEPRLARLKLSSDWRIFQSLSVPQIAEAVLKAHGLTHDYEQRNTTEHQTREYCVQAGDTDYDFVECIMREEGFFYSFRHSAESHQLVHSDRLFIHGRVGDEPVHYNPTPGGDQPQPALRRFAYTENVRTARQTQRDYTFHNPRYTHQHSRDGQGLDHQGRRYERYDYPARAKFDEAGKPFAENRLRGHRRDARIALVEGDDPRLQPGISFTLAGHPRDDMNRGWRPVRIVHRGTQHTSQGEESADAQRGTYYHYTAELVPDDAEWRAEPLPRPRIDGPQNAVVVGPPNEEIYTDEFARVKVHFPWDRLDNQDERSSCWIRVSQNIAGATWGHMAIPRVGQEVIVQFLDGDPDQPIITGRAYNRLQLPAYELPKFKELATVKSKEHKGNRASELRLDDTTSQISAALMNDHGASHLHLGYLTHPRPRGGKPRGEGFELRTDLHGALRAARGLLLTTDEQPDAQGGHLARAQLVQCLESALELARNLGEFAGQHQNLRHDAGPQATLSSAVRDLGHGANDESGGNGGQPLIGLSSPAGIAAATPRSITLAAGQHLDTVAEQNQHVTAGQSIVMNAGQGISQFTHSGDLRHIAHQGQVSVQAQQASIHLQADKSVVVSASNEHVLVTADKHITLSCQGAYIRMQGGDIEYGCPGAMTFKAGSYNWMGAASEAGSLPQFDVGSTQRRFVLTLPDGERPAAGHPYRITLSNGDVIDGVTDAEGGTDRVEMGAMHIASFALLPRNGSGALSSLSSESAMQAAADKATQG
ncbi:type VI secretion system tip protein TssI/VgrG [Achromobacter animicus]|uniref:type VI secretion system Vgr family protein n=1 Tax=Achromobacter animicus TaxID=1389935 RepID=UPI0028AFF1E7|nr:type VI secretion system tip protein TssI/VgrG [Achromobacter animicus]